MNQCLKNNIGLIKYAESQLGKPYWYGTFGQISTEKLYKQKKKQYPKYYTDTDFLSQIGTKVHDCIGLIKGYMWCADENDGKPIYVSNGFPDVSADMMYNMSKKRGNTITTLPEIPGVLVFMKGHVGIYIGNGEVIEARGHRYGVVKTKLSKRPWKKWAFIDQIQYLI